MNLKNRFFCVWIALIAFGCSSNNNFESMPSVEDLEHQIITLIREGDLVSFRGFVINPEKLTSLDEAIFLAPKNGELKISECYPHDQALTKWPSMSDFIKDKADVGDYVLRLKWDYPTEFGIAEVEQYYIITSVNGSYFVKV